VTGENRRDNANEELSRAEICLNEARALHAAAFPYGAVSRVYYAVFHFSGRRFLDQAQFRSSLEAGP